MSNGSLATSHALDADSPRPAPVLSPPPPRVSRKIAAIERHGVIWMRRLTRTCLPVSQGLCGRFADHWQTVLEGISGATKRPSSVSSAFVHDIQATAAKLLNDAVVRDDLVDEGVESAMWRTS